MDLTIIKEYGLPVALLFTSLKGLHMLYVNMREDAETSRENMQKMFDTIQQASKDNENRIINVMKEQSEIIKDIGKSVSSNNLKLCIIERIIEEIKKEIV